MATHPANGDTRYSLWLRVREFAVPPSVIEAATARRRAGDWAGACAAAGVDVDVRPRAVARTHGHDLAARLRDDLRHLAPDLLRWHLPRIAPDGLLRPGLTLTLARYATGPGDPSPVHLVARTAPAWADGGQRISLALWDGQEGRRPAATPSHPSPSHGHPHPRPSRWFRLDLHRHLWDARRAGELAVRAGTVDAPDGELAAPPAELADLLPPDQWCAVERWAEEAALVLRAEGRLGGGAVAVRLGRRRRLVLDVGPDGAGGAPVVRGVTPATAGRARVLPALPHAATWVLPDLHLLRAGLLDAGALHPLVASALVPESVTAAGDRSSRPTARGPRLVECRGDLHRIGLADGVLVPWDHSPEEIRREELLAALTGTPLPCLRVIAEAHRTPDDLGPVRERLDHGDLSGALAVVEDLLGPGASLPEGALRDELEAAAQRRVAHGLFRAGLAEPGGGSRTGWRTRPRPTGTPVVPGPLPGRVVPDHRRSREHPFRPRHANRCP
ncbi:hypothetical protein ACF1AO_27325 [Streptomyces longwoodensis]|uniref:hypothetical protein n=1 Tax=Streptomyces longwoodensis TaxID=68231 RepID=UPI0036FA0F09